MPSRYTSRSLATTSGSSLTDEPRFIVLASSDMPSIAYKLLVRKAFGVWPSDEDVEFHVRPDLVPDGSKAYVADRHAVDPTK